jgi:hypothetical protein
MGLLAARSAQQEAPVELHPSMEFSSPEIISDFFIRWNFVSPFAWVASFF